MDAAELVGLLADPARLRVVAALVLGAHGTDEIVEATHLDEKTVATALDRLHTGGLIEDAPRGYLLRKDLFRQAARDATSPEVAEKLGYARAPFCFIGHLQLTTP
jgi:DNA-binding transcriptional ArsR family regulator